MQEKEAGSVNIPEVSIRAALAVGFAAAAVYMWATETPMLPYQEYITTTVVAYYFAAKTVEQPKPPARSEPREPVDLDAVDLLKQGD